MLYVYHTYIRYIYIYQRPRRETFLSASDRIFFAKVPSRRPTRNRLSSPEVHVSVQSLQSRFVSRSFSRDFVEFIFEFSFVEFEGFFVSFFDFSRIFDIQNRLFEQKNSFDRLKSLMALCTFNKILQRPHSTPRGLC